MNEQTQVQDAGGELAGTLTVAVAIALLIAGIAAFYLLDTRPDWQRWGSTGIGEVVVPGDTADHARHRQGNLDVVDHILGSRSAAACHRMLAGQEGIEPPTCGFGDRRSAN